MNKLILLFLLAPFSVLAQLGSPAAKPGGDININLGGEPTILNPITSSDAYASSVNGYITEGLMTRNLDTYEWEPYLAESVTISEDKKKYDFTLRKGVVWSDGKPLTIEDVKFSYDVYFDKKYNTQSTASYLEGIEKVEIIDKDKIRFHLKNTYFANFSAIAGGIIRIFPRHIYQNPKKVEDLNRVTIGSGPYVLDTYERGQKIILKKNPRWWGNKDPRFKGVYNFEKIVMKFVKEESVYHELFKKGQLDYIGLTPESFIKKTHGKLWKTKLQKVKTQNKGTKGYNYIGWNLRDPKFQDKKVRRALAHLFNRKLMIKKFLFGMSLPATGPWYRQSIYASPNVEPIPFDIKKAYKLLKEAGWKDTDKDRILDKVINGKKVKMSFTIMNSTKDREKYLTIFKEDAKKAGVEVKIQMVEWNTFLKNLDDGKFDGAALGWSGGAVDIDPKQIWHSSSAIKGGSNFVQYKNPEVDKLIDQARLLPESKDRIPLLRKVYEIIADDAPYLFFFNSKYSLYAHNKKIKKAKDTYEYAIGQDYWWMTE